MKKEQQKGGKLVSSIDSLDVDVNSDRDVEISTTDSKGWRLDQASPMVLRNLYCPIGLRYIEISQLTDLLIYFLQIIVFLF